MIDLFSEDWADMPVAKPLPATEPTGGITTLVFLEPPTPKAKPTAEIEMPDTPVTLADLPPVEGDVLRIPGTDATLRVVSIGVGLDSVESMGTMIDPEKFNAGLTAYAQANGKPCSTKSLEYKRFAKHGREDFNPHLYAFTAQARFYGHTSPALEPTHTNSAGRRFFDTAAVVGLALSLLGRPHSGENDLSLDLWRDAIQAARAQGTAKDRSSATKGTR